MASHNERTWKCVREGEEVNERFGMKYRGGMYEQVRTKDNDVRWYELKKKAVTPRIE